jgi:hypothetical protein
MTYSIDSSYLEYYKCAIADHDHCSFFKDRSVAASFAAGTTMTSGLRTAGRVVHLIFEIAKITFYSLVSLFAKDEDNLARLKEHVKILLIDLSVLVLHPLQMAIHALAIGVAIISPKTAYQMMLAATTPVEWVTSREQSIWQNYHSPIFYQKMTQKIEFNLCSAIDSINPPWAVKCVAKAIFTEFTSVIHSGLVMPFSFTGRFRLFEANPTTLTESQQHMTPILLLHGNRSYESLWAGVLHSMKLAGNRRPVFTMSLPPDCNDLSIILEKIDQIKNLYRRGSNSFEVDLIGHSMGSNLIQGLADYPYKNFRIGKAITIGTPFYFDPKTECKDLLEIIGKRDYLISAKSKWGKSVEVDATHAALIYHPRTLSEINRFL